jgi:hypothetical protein
MYSVISALRCVSGMKERSTAWPVANTILVGAGCGAVSLLGHE